MTLRNRAILINLPSADSVINTGFSLIIAGYVDSNSISSRSN